MGGGGVAPLLTVDDERAAGNSAVAVLRLVAIAPGARKSTAAHSRG